MQGFPQDTSAFKVVISAGFFRLLDFRFPLFRFRLLVTPQTFSNFALLLQQVRLHPVLTAPLSFQVLDFFIVQFNVHQWCIVQFRHFL